MQGINGAQGAHAAHPGSASPENLKTYAKAAASQKSNDLVRFSVAMPESLLMDFDQLVARRGLAKNRSEVVRELAREALLEWQSTSPGTFVMGTLTIVYDHHSRDLQNRLHQIQHDFFDNIVSTMHIHVDSHLCLEVIVLRGDVADVQSISDMIIGTKGIKNGKLVLAAVES